MNTARAPRKLLVFARDPVPGRVKTRLIPALGTAAATRIYWQMLCDTLEQAIRCDAAQCELWLDRAAPQSRIVELAARHGIPIHTQRGGDLGQRMANALASALEAAHQAVLIGSDCPGYSAAYLSAAFDALREHDAVLGPAADGGYVLIGLRANHPELFADIAWGGDRVLDATRQRLRRQALRWSELPTLHDVDEPADLAHFPALAALAAHND